MRKLFLDLDGVLVNTNKYIQETINNSNIDTSIKEAFIELCKSFPWNNFLLKCEEINNSFELLNQLNKIYDLTIITHFYSFDEEKLKIDYITTNFKGIKYITVPFEKKKDEMVDAKNCILVDDYYVNIENWNNSGGIGLYFSSNTNKNTITIDNLSYLLDDNFIERILNNE
jgi:hypothetical protein